MCISLNVKIFYFYRVVMGFFFYKLISVDINMRSRYVGKTYIIICAFNIDIWEIYVYIYNSFLP